MITYVGEVAEKCDSEVLYAILIREKEEEKGMYGKTNDFGKVKWALLGIDGR